jgi:hypothetical protein
MRLMRREIQYVLQTYGNSADYKTKPTIYYTNSYMHGNIFLYYNQQIKQETVKLWLFTF